jgi:hypothetical protein
MKIKLLNSGGYKHCKSVRFPAFVEASQIISDDEIVGYSVSTIELKNVGAEFDRRQIAESINWRFFPTECEIINEN